MKLINSSYNPISQKVVKNVNKQNAMMGKSFKPYFIEKASKATYQMLKLRNFIIFLKNTCRVRERERECKNEREREGQQERKKGKGEGVRIRKKE